MADTLFHRLKSAVRADWSAYVDHAFVRGLEDGSLPKPAFRHYLIQDYLFLVQFARAYALAAYKADTVADLRAAAAMVSAILDTEINLHLEYCGEWGLNEKEVSGTPEDLATTAYTRFVLDRGLAGDLLDLHVALAPCVLGYADIGRALAPAAGAGNPYAKWIETYAGEAYQEVAAAADAQLDALFARRAGEARFESLAATFRQATRLEIAFWEMGLEAAGKETER